MLRDSIRVLNFDDSVISQKALLSRHKTEIIDFKDLSSDARLWCGGKAEKIISSRLEKSDTHSVTFLGSGDFHHISGILLERFDMPMCVIDFDYHPDWDILPPRLGCGSWVTRALKKVNILKFVLAGVSSDDISEFAIQTGNLKALKDDKLEIYPYSHGPTRVFFRNIPDNSSVKAKGNFFSSTLYWKQLKDADLKEAFGEILNRLPVKNVYLSVDKDCLKKGYAVTNWEEGMFSLDELVTALKLIKEKADIIGADITGEYSAIKIKNRFKRTLSYLDHPKKTLAGGHTAEEINRINERTNLKILEAII